MNEKKQPTGWKLYYDFDGERLTLYNSLKGYDVIRLKYIRDIEPWWESNQETDYPFYYSDNYFITANETSSTILEMGKLFGYFNYNHYSVSSKGEMELIYTQEEPGTT